MPEERSPEIVRIQAEAPLIDVLGGCSRHEIRIHEHGFIALIDAMPRMVPQGQTADAAIVQAARVSYGQGTKKVSEDRGLIRYLMRHRHTTPFEMVEFKFHVSMPIFIARQWIRHRTANVNEYSGRYSVIPDHFYRPTLDAVRADSKEAQLAASQMALWEEGVRKQSATNRQGGTEALPTATAQDFFAYLDEAEALYHKYESLLSRGVSRELARIGLPVSVYTQWYWKCDLHNILRFLSLRMDRHAQAEIRAYAEAMLALLEPIVPVTVEAWRDYELGAVHLSRLEAEALRGLAKGGSGELAADNRRELAEWAQKRGALGFGQGA